jgi:hypothetical protein
MRCFFISVAKVWFVTGSLTAADWPQWRGSDRNGLGPTSPALANSLVGLRCSPMAVFYRRLGLLDTLLVLDWLA